MAYIGGKSKGADHIIAILNDKKYDNLHFFGINSNYKHQNVNLSSKEYNNNNQHLLDQLL